MFNIPEIITFGTFIVPIRYVVLAVLAYLATYLVKMKTKSLYVSHDQWMEIVLSGLLTYLLVWKFSAIIITPFDIMKNPSLLIYTNGGFLGHLFALPTSLYVMYRSACQRAYSPALLYDLIVYWLICVLTIYWFVFPSYGLVSTLPWAVSMENSTLTYHPINFYKVILGTSLILYASLRKIPFGKGVYGSFLLFLGGVGLLMISNVQFHVTRVMGLAPIQWVYLLISMVGLSIFILIYWYLSKRSDFSNSEVNG